MFVAVLDGNGVPLTEVPGTPQDLSGPLPNGDGVEIDLADGRYLLHVTTLDGGLTGVAGASMRPLQELQASLAQTLLVASVIATLLALLGGWWLAGRALAPVGALTAEAAAIGTSDLARRLSSGRHDDELHRLASTLNAMLERIEDAVQRQRAFLAAASLDLRTPISALQTELELADHPKATVADLRSSIRAALGDAVRLGDLTNSLLELVAAEPEGRALAPTLVSLDAVVASVVEHVGPVAIGHHVTIVSDVESVPIRVDRVRLEQALRNVLTNAISYSSPGGVVDVIGRFDEARLGCAAAVTIEVLDRGPGIPAEEVDLVFEPFVRGSAARGPGTGLGLSAARAAVEAHRGVLTVAPRAGGGACLSMRVPS